ncbi:DUF3817 domain-containing protein [Leptospira ryugenii]|nr:DUF3817 domain-containing protein [Leptospira ryugenii]
MTTTRLRYLGLLEGLSLLSLLYITMPLKYKYQMPLPNQILGMVHGILFVFYVVFLYQIKEELNWSWQKTIQLFLCSVLPFGFVYVEWKELWK